VYLWISAKRQFKKRKFKACASCFTNVVELRAKSSKEKDISGFLNEWSLSLEIAVHNRRNRFEENRHNPLDSNGLTGQIECILQLLRQICLTRQFSGQQYVGFLDLVADSVPAEAGNFRLESDMTGASFFFFDKTGILSTQGNKWTISSK